MKRMVLKRKRENGRADDKEAALKTRRESTHELCSNIIIA